jgi:hypothetical protein
VSFFGPSATGALDLSKALDAALGDDRGMLRACLQRLVPAARGRTLALDLPEDTSPAGFDAVLAEARRALGASEITLDEAGDLADFVRDRVEIRIAALKAALLEAELAKIKTERERQYRSEHPTPEQLARREARDRAVEAMRRERAEKEAAALAGETEKRL